MQTTKGTAAAIQEIVKLGKSFAVAEMATLAEAAEKAGGTVAGIEVDDDRCGNGRFIFKWPPKGTEFQHFLDLLVRSRTHLDILINGIPVPDEILLQVSRQASRAFTR